MNKKVMAIGAHADDIEFNFGGTLLKYHESFGYEIGYVMATNNMAGSWSIGRPDGSRDILNLPWHVLMPQRELEANHAAAECFGTKMISLEHPQLSYRDDNGESVELRFGNPAPACVPPNTPTILTAHESQDAVNKLAQLILDFNPEVIFTHGPADQNPEHTCTCLLVAKAFQQAKISGFDGSLIFCLMITSAGLGDFFDRWDTFIDTTGYYEKKLKAIGIHACQVPFPERLDLCDKTWGASCGCTTAEVFIIGELSTKNDGILTSELRNNFNSCN